MLVTEVTVRIHETVNTGDYSNYKPEIALTATLDASDDAELVLGQLISQATDEIANLVDDALERNGRTPKYSDPLYKVRYNLERRCIVIVRLGIELPNEKTWRDTDKWRTDSDNPYPDRMRFHTAQKLAQELRRNKEMPFFIINEPDMLESLPALPDPGPEPLWSIKGLRENLKALGIPEAIWEQLGELPHVDNTYLDKFYRWMHHNWSTRISTEERVNMFLIGYAPWEKAAALPGSDDIRYGFSEGEDDEEE